MKNRLLSLPTLLFVTITTLLIQNLANAGFDEIAGEWHFVSGDDCYVDEFTITTDGKIPELYVEVDLDDTSCQESLGHTFEDIKIKSDMTFQGIYEFEEQLDKEWWEQYVIIFKANIDRENLRISFGCVAAFERACEAEPPERIMLAPQVKPHVCHTCGTSGDGWCEAESSPSIIDVKPSFYYYGDVKVGDYKNKKFIVKNTGLITLSVSGTELIGDDANEFSIQSGGGAHQLYAKKFVEIVVRFSPTSVGEKSAKLRIFNNDETKEVSLSAIAFDGPRIVATINSYNYGNITEGEHKDNTFAVKNEGTKVLSVSSTELVGDNADEFSIQSGGGSFNLNPGETRKIVVRFSPESAGKKNAKIQISSNDTIDNLLDIPLTGSSLPDIAVTYSSRNYGDVKVGEYTDNTFVVKNEGFALLSVSSTELVGDDASDFSIQSGGGSFDLNPSETRDVIVRFSPQSGGNKKATLRFDSNDPDENPYDVALGGSSIDASLKWKFKTDSDVKSSPAIGSDGTIYVGSVDDYLYAINPDGTEKWKFQTGSYVTSSPAIGKDGTIYTGSFDDYLYAINPDGTLKWKFKTGGNYVTSSPAIGSDGTIYVGSDDDYLYAINPDGTEKWKFQTGDGVDSSPAIGSDGTIYVGSEDDYLYAINPDGTEKWKFQTGDGVWSSPAIGSDGTIYVGSYGDYLYAINPDGTEKWKFQTGSYVTSSPAIGKDGTIYVGSYDDYLYAINPDGTEKWKFKTDSDVKSSPAIGSDGTIYVGSYDDYLYAINPDGTEKWKVETVSFVYSSPAIGSDGIIYVGSHHYLYALYSDSMGLADSPWPKFHHDSQNTGSASFIAPSSPQINISTDSISFGEVKIEDSGKVTVSIGNTGSATLNVTNITSTLGKIFTISETKFTVAPGAKKEITLTLTPASEGEISGTLIITSNAPNSPTMEIAITGDAQLHKDELTFDLMLNAGINLISIPLANATVDVEGEPVTISRVSDLGKALGNTWNLIISRPANKFETFLPSSSETTPANVEISGTAGLIVVMKSAFTLSLRGQAWPEGDTTLTVGINIVGIPLKNEEVTSVYDLDQKLGEGVNLIISLNPDTGKFRTFLHQAAETIPSNITIDGDTGLIVVTKAESVFTVMGEPWSNENRRIPFTAAPRHALRTPDIVTSVMEVDGMIAREDTGAALNNISVTVRHLSSGTVTTDAIGVEDAGRFSVTIVDFSHNCAAQIGDIFEINFRDHSRQFYLEPIRRLVTQADVQQGRITVGDVIAYVIPSHSALLPNWPNPFNPDTWIPFQLSKSADDVTLRIYDARGRLVRTLTLGYVPAGIYRAKARAIYWNGTNDVGERVASGVYFYHLRAGNFSSSRKMVILK